DEDRRRARGSVGAVGERAPVVEREAGRRVREHSRLYHVARSDGAVGRITMRHFLRVSFASLIACFARALRSYDGGRMARLAFASSLVLLAAGCSGSSVSGAPPDGAATAAADLVNLPDDYQPACGNGLHDPGEQCDDGVNAHGSGCEPDCTLTCRT